MKRLQARNIYVKYLMTYIVSICFGAMCFTFTNESYSATGIKNIYNCLVMLLFEMSLTLVYCIADYGINNPITSVKLMLYNFNKRDDYSSNLIYHYTYMALCSQEYHYHFRHKSKDDLFQNGLEKHIYTVYPKKYAHGFVVLCFVVVMQSFIMNSHQVFIHIHQGCFAGTGAIVRLPQCQ